MTTRSSKASLLPFPAPRAGTPRTPDRITVGDQVAAWHLAMNGEHLLPWQAHVADIAGELDDDGFRHWDTVFVKVPRQQGKSWLIEAQLVAAAHRPGPRGEPVRRLSAYAAQDGQMAALRITKELGVLKLGNVPPLRGRYSVRKSNGQCWVEFEDLSRIQAISSSDRAAHGMTLDDAVLDEAFGFRDLSMINAVQPTMVSRPDPQLWIVSTPGDGADALMMHYEELAAAAVNDPASRMAVFDWSAVEDDDRADPAVWARVMPAFGRTVSESRIRSYLNTTPPAEFDRAYLARRPTASSTAALDLGAWADCGTETPIQPAGGVTVAVELNPDRSHGVIAVAAKHDDHVAVLVDRQPGTRWLTGAIRELVHRRGLTVVDVWADRRSGLGGVIDELAGIGIDVHNVTAGDVASACGTLYDLVNARQLAHARQHELDAAVTGSRRRPLGDAWAFSKLESVGDVTPAAAVALAVAAYRQHFPTGAGLGGIR